MRGLGFAPLYGCIAYALTAVEFVVILLDKVCKIVLIGRKPDEFRFFLLCLRIFTVRARSCECNFGNLFVGLAKGGTENNVC